MLKLLSKSALNLLRQWIITIPTILVIASTLTIFHGLLTLHDRAQIALQEMQQKFSITVYLRDDADPFEVGNLITALEERKDVIKPVVYTSKEAAWELMSKTFALDNELLKKYKFSLPASLTITPANLDGVPRLEAFLETNAKQLLKDPLISKDKQKNIANQMFAFVQSVKNAALKTIILFTALFIFGGALMIASAIHLAFVSRHLEINIMKLVGASYSNISSPFVVEGIMIGLLAFILHLILLLTLPFSISKNSFHLNAILLELLAVLALAGSASYLTVRLHLRKKLLI